MNLHTVSRRQNREQRKFFRPRYRALPSEIEPYTTFLVSRLNLHTVSRRQNREQRKFFRPRYRALPSEIEPYTTFLENAMTETDFFLSLSQ